MADKIKERTAGLLVEEQEKEMKDRPCAVYTVRQDALLLKDITNEKPIDYPNEIHISWLDSALNQFAKEQKYSAWDLIQAPQGAWVGTAYGNKCGIVAGADSQVIITLDNGNTWETVSVIADLSCIAFGSKTNADNTVTNRFIALSSAGQGIYSDDNGKTWQTLTMPNDNYTGIIYIQGKFIAISSTGKIYTSYDMGITFNELTIDITGFQFTSIATDGDKKVMIVGSSGTNRALYSDDVANKFKETNLAQNTWTSIAYGEGKFIAVSTDGNNNIAAFDVNTNKWAYTQAPTQEEWRSVSYGARVFTAVATGGKVISSLNGNRWLAVAGHIGEWNTILRTDFFFIALSIADNEQGYNAMRSSNAGMTLNEFATLQEVIEQEPTLKAVSPQVLIDYLKYRTGKNKGQFVTYDEDNYINTLVEKANSLNHQVIDETSSITSYDEIIEDGYYIINKNLSNKPQENYVMLIVMSYTINNIKIIIQQCFEMNYYYPVCYVRKYYNSQWSSWKLNNISQTDINEINLSADNITVSKSSTQTAVNTFLITDKKGDIATVGKDDVLNEIIDEVNAGIDLSNYVTTTDFNSGLAGKQDKGNYFNKDSDKIDLANQVTGTLATANIADGAVTDAKFSGRLSVQKGGTGTANGLGWKNCLSKKEFKAITGWTVGTSKEFVESIPNNCSVYVGGYWNKTDITDLPTNNYFQFSMSRGRDGNGTYIIAYAGANIFKTYIYTAQTNTWIKIRERDGSIPAELISPTVLKYTNSSGTWTETKLTTGEVMLEGWGEATTGSTYGSFIVYCPKTLKTDTVYANGTVLFADYPYGVGIGGNSTANYIELRFVSDKGELTHMDVRWYVKGILA